MPNSVSSWAAAAITDQSESEPMTTPTRGPSGDGLAGATGDCSGMLAMVSGLPRRSRRRGPRALILPASCRPAEMPPGALKSAGWEHQVAFRRSGRLLEEGGGRASPVRDVVEVVAAHRHMADLAAGTRILAVVVHLRDRLLREGALVAVPQRALLRAAEDVDHDAPRIVRAGRAEREV